MKSKSYGLIATDLVFVAIIMWILSSYVRYALVAPPSFDGAMALNTARSFFDGHGYGFFYSVFFPFPAQTDGPVTLPAGLLMRMGGVTPLTTQGVNLAYLVGTVIVSALLLRRMTRSSVFSLAGTIVLLMTPGLSQIAMGGFGEVPSLFWLLLSLIVLAPALDELLPSHARLALGGIALALCFLTKTVALLLVAPTVGLFILVFVLRHRADAIRVVWLLAGLALPILGWEVFRLVEIGSLHGYREWWHLQIGQAMAQSGAAETLHAGRGPITKTLEHLRILGDLIGTPVAALAVFLLVPWSVAAAVLIDRWRRNDLGNLFCVAACGSISVLYFLWWLVIEQTQMAWLRRVVDGLAIQQILLVVAIVTLIRLCREGGRSALPRRLLSGILAVALAWSTSFLLINGQTITHPLMATAVDLDTPKLAEKLRELPADATLFGFGWWKAPVLALFSGRPIANFYYWDPAEIDALPHKYLVLDFFARALAQQDAQDILAAGTSHLIADSPAGAIYELDDVQPYKSFTAVDRDPAKLRSNFSVADGPYAATRGFYAAEGASAWAKPDAALLLRRTDQSQLVLSIYVPPQLAPERPGDPLRLHIASGACLDNSVPVEPGVRTIVLPLTCPVSTTPEAMDISLHINGHVPNSRQIDADARRLAYLVSDIRLQRPL